MMREVVFLDGSLVFCGCLLGLVVDGPAVTGMLVGVGMRLDVLAADGVMASL